MGQPVEPAADAAVVQTEGDAAVLEIERFEWAAPDRIELVGRWSGLRGRRFIRPTLVLRREGETKRLLASLEHKPWDPGDDGGWTAVFTWDGEPEKFESAELNVGSGIDLDLPRPRMRPGKPSTRFRHRAVSRAPGPMEEGHALLRRPEVNDQQTDTVEEVVGKPETPRDEATTDLERARAERPRDEATTDLERARAEREAALSELRDMRAALEEERQSREAAIAAARAEEREKFNPLLGQAAELRAGVERQREMAFLERDDAFTERDRAREAEADSLRQKKEAVAQRKEAERERDRAFAERDRALKDRDRAVQACVAAERERDGMRDERDAACKERDTIVDLHERELPIHPPQPKFLPREDQAPADVWAPRAIAAGLLLAFTLVVLRLFAGL